MPAPINAFATNFELALVFSGVVLLWRYVFSPTARAQTRTPLLAAWDISLSDFFLFLWIVICGGLVFPVVAQQTARALALSAQTKLILVNAGFQGGMLAGVGVYALCFNRSRSRPSFAFTASILPGIATFLISLPLIVVVGLLWTGLLKLCGLPVEPQDAVAFFKKAQPPALLATMIALAALVAPLTEELVFRAGIFRYARTRLPRWAALLLPAVLFGALHAHLPSFAPLVALGIVFALAYERTGRIGTAIVAHALFNSYSVLRIFIDPSAN
jgi:membrane protease YdiL (CAAX protease family)